MYYDTETLSVLEVSFDRARFFEDTAELNSTSPASSAQNTARFHFRLSLDKSMFCLRKSVHGGSNGHADGERGRDVGICSPGSPRRAAIGAGGTESFASGK